MALSANLQIGAPAAAAPATLKQRVLRAGGWTLTGYALGHAIRLGSNLIMTRLLVPEMFGVMLVATMVMVILGLLSDLGLTPNIVQSRRGDEPAFLDTAWVVQIVRGIGLWLLALLLSAALYLANLADMLAPKSVYATPELPLVIAVSAFAMVIAGFQSTRMASAQRHLDQKRLSQIALVSQIAALVVMIVLGVLTRSIWALVAGGLVGSVATTLLSHTWMSGHPNRWRWDAAAARELIAFGKWIFASSVVSVLAANGDRLLLGGFVDAEVLGLYAIATLIVFAVDGLSGLFVSVALPALAQIAREEPSRLREIYYRLRVPSDLFFYFMAGLLFAAGQLVIDLLYDPRYSGSGPMLQVFALSLVAIRFRGEQQIYLALGLARHVMVLSLVRFVALWTLVPALFYLGGIQAAIWGIALHALASAPFVYRFNAHLGLNDFRRELLILAALPAGLLCGSALNGLVR